jgi:hypothetical protein
MTINELANVHMGDVDNATNEKIGHSAKYRRVIAKLGYEEVKKCIPYTLDEIKAALPKDRWLNNLPMVKWDRASGFYSTISGGSQHWHQINAPLVNLYRKAGVNSFSPSDGVCILKEAARMWAEE